MKIAAVQIRYMIFTIFSFWELIRFEQKSQEILNLKVVHLDKSVSMSKTIPVFTSKCQIGFFGIEKSILWLYLLQTKSHFAGQCVIFYIFVWSPNKLWFLAQADSLRGAGGRLLPKIRIKYVY